MKYDLVWSSYGEPNMDKLPEMSDELVLVINANRPVILVIKAIVTDEKNLVDLIDYRDKAVEPDPVKYGAIRKCLNDITNGCNYRYYIIRKYGNTYFCN